MNTRSKNTLRKRKKRRRRIVLFTLLPLLLLMLGAVAYGGYLLTKAYDVAAGSKEELARGEISEKRIAAVDPKKDSISILIMGVDDSNVRDFGHTTRTDALILATFNVNSKSVKLVSIPRDSYVYIPDKMKRDKITHAHVYGGTEGTIETVEELFDLPVDYFVKLNFNAFIDVVDTLGGIKVDVPITFSEQDSKDTANAIHLEKGLQKLNGEEALALARTRKIDNDIERGKRQQLVLRAIIDKAVSVGSITKYGGVMESMGNNMSTNLEFGEILGLFEYATSGLNIESIQLEGQDNRINGIYYYQLDELSVLETAQELREHLELTALATNMYN
ncbi:LCP family protein [Niallia sp. XMNu-256]|uniref:LCP family protein n=1 Tax=Niallia sp. XMNu-256 TaxID=3082444 RepID=UPI0030D01202